MQHHPQQPPQHQHNVHSLPTSTLAYVLLWEARYCNLARAPPTTMLYILAPACVPWEPGAHNSAGWCPVPSSDTHTPVVSKTHNNLGIQFNSTPSHPHTWHHPCAIAGGEQHVQNFNILQPQQHTCPHWCAVGGAKGVGIAQSKNLISCYPLPVYLWNAWAHKNGKLYPLPPSQHMVLLCVVRSGNIRQ